MRKGILKSISIGEERSFEHNYEIMNACFGCTYLNDLQKSVWDAGDGCKVWFPFEAIESNGRYEPGSKNVNWKNILKDNGETIIQFLYPEENASDEKIEEPEVSFGGEPIHTFMKFGNKNYRYVGTFFDDIMASAPRYQVARRISDHIDLATWYNGFDESYTDFNVNEIQCLKNYYLDRSLTKQKEKISEFEVSGADHSEELKARADEARAICKFVQLTNMTEDRFKKEFVPSMSKALSTLFGDEVSEEAILVNTHDFQKWGNAFTDLYDNEKSVNERLCDCPWGSRDAARIMTLEDSQFFLFTLSEYETERFLKLLRIDYKEEDSLVLKQAKLYFWKNCNYQTMFEWDIFKYYDFLKYLLTGKKENVRYIQAPKPTIEKIIKNEAEDAEQRINNDSLENVQKEFEYVSSPRPREINIINKSKSKIECVRHDDRKINALIKADYCCELNPEHPTFKRRKSEKNYTETHHLIPLEYSLQFDSTLDTEENIVSLCSNCHNQIHYGEGAEVLLKKLYDSRIDLLRTAGISKTIDGIEVTFEQLLHMYRLD